MSDCFWGTQAGMGTVPGNSMCHSCRPGGLQKSLCPNSRVSRTTVSNGLRYRGTVLKLISSLLSQPPEERKAYQNKRRRFGGLVLV